MHNNHSQQFNVFPSRTFLKNIYILLCIHVYACECTYTLILFDYKKLGSYSYCSETCFFHFAIYDGHFFRKVHMGLASFLQWRGMLAYWYEIGYVTIPLLVDISSVTFTIRQQQTFMYMYPNILPWVAWILRNKEFLGERVGTFKMSTATEE